jgi:AraC-like DNA-binding protein
VGNDKKEAPIWARVDGEWRALFGGYAVAGVSVEWHDFVSPDPLAWSETFHPGSLELCLNLEGRGRIRHGRDAEIVLQPRMMAQYAVSGPRLSAERTAGERHRFLTVEMSRDWLSTALQGHEETLNAETRRFLEGKTSGRQSKEAPLPQRLRPIIDEVVHTPMGGAGSALWFQAKILEIVAHALTEPVGELFCQRHKRQALERVEQVKALLAADLEHPPTLTQLGRAVGCSPFYLSRIFSETTGTTISRHLRTVRLERAAALLRSGECNVTEAALTVGYSSLSHFSKAFAEQYGECPCVFPLRPAPIRT